MWTSSPSYLKMNNSKESTSAKHLFELEQFEKVRGFLLEEDGVSGEGKIISARGYQG